MLSAFFSAFAPTNIIPTLTSVFSVWSWGP